MKKLKKEGKIDYTVSFSGPGTIDKRGIARAVRGTTARAVRKLGLNSARCQVLLDGTLFAPLEIPIGVITAVIGAPIFIVLMKTRERVK